MTDNKADKNGPDVSCNVLCHLLPQLLPCEAAIILEKGASPRILSTSSGHEETFVAQSLIDAMMLSTERLSAEGGVDAGLFPQQISGFRSWASKPIGSKDGHAVLVLCLNSSADPFPSPSLTRLATLTANATPSETRKKSSQTGRSVSGISDLARYLDTRISPSEISSSTPLALLRLDLGRITPINDRDGWPASDALIDRANTLIREFVPSHCFTVHLGGGSFAIVLPVEKDVSEAEALAEDLVRRMQEDVAIPRDGFPFEPYIGWACYPFDAPDANTLIGFANAALARIRGLRAGPHINRVAPEIAHAHADEIGMESDLRQSLIDNAFTLNWLPVLETGTEHVVTFEALVRWKRPGHGDVDPTLFLRCAETAGLIEDIDSWVLHTACRQAQSWKEPLGLSVNVSPSWLATERVATTIRSALKESGLDPLRLQIEFSERSDFGPLDIARKELARIRGMGVRLILDDFGTGIGALERLTNYPFDQVKLDRAFVCRVGVDSRVETVLRCTLYMIHALNMSCCAEGVETEEQLGFLEAHGCEEIQGYLIGQPTLRQPDSLTD
ncbi:MAG: GGDEF domain-containing phosphodiesterase [Acetobacter aceti]|uniref:Diguanylate cyclase n=1 Tax=Acetobacter aceti TaxID=435 RepID=A0A1U9KEZ0_ACEAC|nr:GGDEF domain-containing phosphodiesterase [Acetobacter aceti]AQS84297.1 diguanylate cyclase [Acetobacter aceti]